MNIQITLTVPEDVIDNLLVSAFEGGSNYWVTEARRGRKPTRKGAEWVSEWPIHGGSFIIVDGEDDGKEYEIGSKELKKGLEAMSEWKEGEGAHHFQHIVGGNDAGQIDADTGDAFLQACCFGKLIYG